MNKTDYFHDLMKNGQTTVPNHSIVDILLMVQKNGRDAQVLNVGSNQSVMFLIHED